MLIDRDMTLERMKSMAGCATCDNYNYVRCRACSWDDAMNIVEEMSEVDAVPVVHGRWITNKYGEIVCSECDNNALQVLTGCLVNRHFEPHKSKFCPNCGAKMDGDEGVANETD